MKKQLQAVQQMHHGLNGAVLVRLPIFIVHVQVSCSFNDYNDVDSNESLVMTYVSDNNGGDGGDFELISQHRDQNPNICQRPKAIDYKTQRNRFIFSFHPLCLF